jgi:histidyl-tRNA synthetase
MKNIVQSVKGTRDFYPEQMAIRTWLYQMIRQVSERFGYQEYEGPFIEKIELYAAKSGDELVNQQSFVFQDRGGDPVTLRPELTPTLARMVAQKQNELAFPLRWWSFGPFWRYERPQKGRTREFFQWNIDIIGVNTPEADAELLAVCAEFFRAVGLTSEKVRLMVNSRRLMDTSLARYGLDGDLKRTAFQLIDRKDKLPTEEWRKYALEQGLSTGQLDGIISILEDKDLWKQSEELSRAFSLLEQMDLGESVRFDAAIIRGLDYYTGIVFEAKDQDGGRSILGGGHYDNLVAAVGGDPLPAVGFAMGDVMFGLILEKYGLVPTFPPTPAQVLVTVFDESRLQAAFMQAEALRRTGLRVASYPETAKLQKQLKYADRIGVRFVVVTGPAEDAAGMVTLKDLSERTQMMLPFGAAADKIRAILAQG